MSRDFIPEAGVLPTQGQPDRGKAQMRNRRHWIVDRACKRPELMRGRPRLDTSMVARKPSWVYHRPDPPPPPRLLARPAVRIATAIHAIVNAAVAAWWGLVNARTIIFADHVEMHVAAVGSAFGGGLAQESFELGKGQFDWVEVGRVSRLGWQAQWWQAQWWQAQW